MQGAKADSNEAIRGIIWGIKKGDVIDMSFVKKNKGAIIFYLVLVLATLVIVQNNSKNLEENKGYVYLTR